MTAMSLDADAYETLGLALAELKELKADYAAMESRLDDALCALRDVIARAVPSASAAAAHIEAETVVAVAQPCEDAAAAAPQETCGPAPIAPAVAAAIAAQAFFLTVDEAMPSTTDTVAVEAEAVCDAVMPELTAQAQPTEVVTFATATEQPACEAAPSEEQAAASAPIVVPAETLKSLEAVGPRQTARRRPLRTGPWMATAASLAAVATYLAYAGGIDASTLTDIEWTGACVAVVAQFKSECVRIAAALM